MLVCPIAPRSKVSNNFKSMTPSEITVASSNTSVNIYLNLFFLNVGSIRKLPINIFSIFGFLGDDDHIKEL